MKNKKESLSILIEKYGFKTAEDWVKFLKIGHSKEEIFWMDSLDYYYPCWAEEIEYSVNNKEEFKLWYKKFENQCKTEREKLYKTLLLKKGN
jgi:hypothetical protein